jgi:phospholipid/cholesterol/gamma-HCH transport system substrate-binding protein
VPSRKQLKWSELKVGLTVLAASVTLAVLILLMNSTGGIFTRKVTLLAYFDDASGLRRGAPVQLSGVSIGNVANIRIVAGKPKTPVEVVMKVNTKYLFGVHTDSVATLATAGVLGETYVNIVSADAMGPEAKNGAVLPTYETPDIQDVIRSSQGTLQNLDALVSRLNRIVASIEGGNGSIGKLIYDPTLYNRLNSTVTEFQGLVNEVGQGQGTLGKLLTDDTIYKKANASVDKLNALLDNLNAGQGTAGKFLKDPTLYNNANQAIANVKELTDEINAGKGALGTLARNQEFANKLKNTMNKLSAITDQLQAGQGSAGKFLKDETMYNNTNNLLVESRNLIKAIRQNPKKYLTIHLKLF